MLGNRVSRRISNMASVKLKTVICSNCGKPKQDSISKEDLMTFLGTSNEGVTVIFWCHCRRLDQYRKPENMMRRGLTAQEAIGVGMEPRRLPDRDTAR